MATAALISCGQGLRMFQGGVDQELQARRVPQPQLASKLAAQESGGAAQSGQLLVGVATGAEGQKPDARAAEVLEQATPR